MNTDFRHWIEPIKEELRQHIEDNINYWNDSSEDFHHQLFNEDYYLIGYYECQKWLDEHGVNIFDGIAFVQGYEEENFGSQGVRRYEDAERLVNMIVYIIGEDLIYNEQYHKNFIFNEN